MIHEIKVSTCIPSKVDSCSEGGWYVLLMPRVPVLVADDADKMTIKPSVRLGNKVLASYLAVIFFLVFWRGPYNYYQ